MDVRSRVKDGLQAVAGASEVPRSDREIYLSLSEYGRRLGGDVPKVTDLTAFELKVFSQNGEDGVIGEILRRIGAPERGGFFVEFGAETGLETNCAVLAEVRGWGGLYIEAGDASFAALEARYRHRPDVTTLQSMVTPVNVESLFERGGVP
jgi:hypothetical protein